MVDEAGRRRGFELRWRRERRVRVEGQVGHRETRVVERRRPQLTRRQPAVGSRVDAEPQPRVDPHIELEHAVRSGGAESDGLAVGHGVDGALRHLHMTLGPEPLHRGVDDLAVDQVLGRVDAHRRARRERPVGVEGERGHTGAVGAGAGSDPHLTGAGRDPTVDEVARAGHEARVQLHRLGEGPGCAGEDGHGEVRQSAVGGLPPVRGADLHLVADVGRVTTSDHVDRLVVDQPRVWLCDQRGCGLQRAERIELDGGPHRADLVEGGVRADHAVLDRGAAVDRPDRSREDGVHDHAGRERTVLVGGDDLTARQVTAIDAVTLDALGHAGRAERSQPGRRSPSRTARRPAPCRV